MIKAKISRKRILPLERFQKIPAKVDIAVGLVGPKAEAPHNESEELSVAEIGTIHEFGNDHVPARKWLSTSFKQQRERIKNAYAFAWKKQFRRTRINLNAVAASTGALAARSIKMHMLKGPYFKPKLSPITVRRKQAKGSLDPKRPMVDSLQMTNAISWKKL